ncbi:hypothetical protein EAI_04135 [Harpegnathos saltator]|uniref:Uncharacterized protein n=1 Tax=Harpegnathos saltator TaxID=610380 RepID=E2BD23_HARSA|nr:hypothetical protein EAI_04135 [Harpegnathos saltator]
MQKFRYCSALSNEVDGPMGIGRQGRETVTRSTKKDGLVKSVAIGARKPDPQSQVSRKTHKMGSIAAIVTDIREYPAKEQGFGRIFRLNVIELVNIM